MKFKTNKKGLTLVELMVSLALISVVLAAIGIALSSYGRQYADMTKRLRAQETASLIAERIEFSVRYAETAYISVSESSFGCNMISSCDGRLYYKELSASDFVPYAEEAGYNGFNCNVIFTKASNNSVNAEIIVYKGDATALGIDIVPDNDYLYRTNRTIRLLNTSDSDREFVTSTIVENDTVSHIFKFK